jgi:proteic killer suppression protein
MVEKIRLILYALEEAGSIDDLNQPSFRLHPLKGDFKGYWACDGSCILADRLSV